MMDPDACWEELCEALAQGDFATATSKANDLDNWLVMGGSMPSKLRFTGAAPLALARRSLRRVLVSIAEQL